MNSNNESIADWANLPHGVEAISIWECIHDAALEAVASDILARTLTITFDVYYLRTFHKLPEDLKFSFLLRGVQSVRAMRFTVWPGERPLPPGLSWEEQQRQENENRKLWREESESWGSFESAVRSDEDAELTEGDMVGAAGLTTLRLGVQMSVGEWYEVFVRAEELTVVRSDGMELTAIELLSLGHAYWEAFAKRSVEQQDKRNTNP